MAGGFGLLTADLIGPGTFGGPQWGIFYPDGSPVIVADSFYDLDYDRRYKISDYPQEQGAFMSYNKVKTPFDSQVGFLSNQTRFELLSVLEPIVASLDLVAVVTPEMAYPSANLTGYRFRRATQNGVTLVLIIVSVREVRIVTTSPVSSAQSTNAAVPAQSGAVQTVPAGNSTFADVAPPVSPTTTPAPPAPADANFMDINAITAGRKSGISFPQFEGPPLNPPT